MKIEAKDLQSALIEASTQLECSVVDLKYHIIQHHRGGFLGFGRRNAIIEVETRYKIKKKIPKKEVKIFYKGEERKPVEFKKEGRLEATYNASEEKYIVKNEAIFDSFHKEDMSAKKLEDIRQEIKFELEKLLESLSFNIHLVDIKILDDVCVFIHIDGEDAPLMIGKEAHRYKALSYILHYWISLKYNLFVRLEIAQFLEKQTQALNFYLQTVIEKIEQNGRGQTKPLDGVLIKIALEELRAKFPNKYVAIKQNGDQKFIVINDFYERK